MRTVKVKTEKLLKIILIITLFINGGRKLNAQIIYGEGMQSPIEFEGEFLDSTERVVYYRYNVVKEDIRNKITQEENTLILQLGKKYNKFIDLGKIKADSLESKIKEERNYLDHKEATERSAYWNQRQLNKSTIKNLETNRYLVRSRFDMGKFEYEMGVPDFKWKIESDKKELLGYMVQKATLNYAGRIWTAWYAEEFPVSEGPYIFEGLPGLILEMYDADDNFHFTAIGIENKKMSIYKSIEKDIDKTNRAKYFETERKFHENPELYNSSYKAYGFDEIPYNPIEIVK